jgi:hypothetical protein
VRPLAYDDARRLRGDDLDADDELSRRPAAVEGASRRFLAKTKTVTSYPTAAGKFYAMETQDVLGTQSEGSAATFSGQGDTFYALNLGSAIPPVGTIVEVTHVPHRFVFRYDG